jgi:hypothetical protein
MMAGDAGRNRGDGVCRQSGLSRFSRFIFSSDTVDNRSAGVCHVGVWSWVGGCPGFFTGAVREPPLLGARPCWPCRCRAEEPSAGGQRCWPLPSWRRPRRPAFVGAPLVGAVTGVPSMFDSLEVKVPLPDLMEVKG